MRTFPHHEDSLLFVPPYVFFHFVYNSSENSSKFASTFHNQPTLLLRKVLLCIAYVDVSVSEELPGVSETQTD